jgi:hypothetical protein
MELDHLNRTMELSMPLPSGLDSRIYIRLDVQAKSVVVFLTTASSEDSSAAPIGSFVYALPNAYNPAEPLSTPLLAEEPTIDLTTRVAKLLARKLEMPVHVSNSMSFANTIMGGSVEEEMAAFREVMAVVLDKVREAQKELIV